ncbi:type II toxin-antitoxin system RelE/ParE family toxin [Methylacidiphilales bacterium]|nr:type II toxin-antitoxin system RelE/ParE family toxin [Candidatus Methylacidiphilales bacterium]
MDYRFKIASQAKRDIKNIWLYIARDNSTAADNFCDALLLAAESLQSFPHRIGPIARTSDIRKIAFETYLIFYRVDEKTSTVEILRFWHAARDQNRLHLREEPVGYALSSNLAS